MSQEFKIGDRVRVVANAKLNNGGKVFFGCDTVGEVVDAVPGDSNVRVNATALDGKRLNQWVGVAYLTKIADDAISVDALKKAFGALGYEAVDQDRVLDVARVIEEAARG